MAHFCTLEDQSQPHPPSPIYHPPLRAHRGNAFIASCHQVIAALEEAERAPKWPALTLFEDVYAQLPTRPGHHRHTHD